MSHFHLHQWKSAGRRVPCCKFEDDKRIYKQRNRRLRHFAKHTLHNIVKSTQERK